MDSLELCQEAGRSREEAPLLQCPGPLDHLLGDLASLRFSHHAPAGLPLTLPGSHRQQRTAPVPATLTSLGDFFPSWMDLQFDCHHGNSRVLVHEGGGKSSLLESLFQLLQRTCVAAADLWRKLACSGPGDRQDAGYLTSQPCTRI